MKIERINDNSIKCTLTSFDLSVRNLNVRELAYGSEKAKKLFEEMMNRASDEVGFSAENTPLMIEAIPMNGDSIQLIISKVDDPEELDARFSRFTKNPSSENVDRSWLSKLTSELLEGASSIFGQLQKMNPSLPETKAAVNEPAAPVINDKPVEKASVSAKSEKTVPVVNKEKAIPVITETRAFVFEGLGEAINACKAANSFSGNSTLYKKPDGIHFVLVIDNKDVAKDNFSKTCNLLAEYGRMLKTVSATISYYNEHYTVIAENNAIEKLSKI